MDDTAQPADAPVVRDAASQQKQPGVLYMLFATEAWERFSYYGMRAILLLYMAKVLSFEQGTRSMIYGIYTALVYLTPLAGGLIADRVLGYRRSILLGGVMMAIGQFLLTVPRVPFFAAGLGMLILGNGLFKPNISTIVGTLYGASDPRRDRGFTIFYMGINLGAAFSPIVCGQLLAQNEALGPPEVSFPWGFRAAGIGMLIGFVTFFFGQRSLGERGKRPGEARSPDSPPMSSPSGTLVSNKGDAGIDTPLTKVEKNRILAIFLAGLFTIFFWMAFEQAGNTMTEWAENSTDRNIFGWTASSSLFQFVNPAFILLLAPAVSLVWKLLGPREPSSPAKMVIGLTFLGAGFVPLMIAAVLAGSTGRASWVWLILAYFLHTTGELCLSPIGLSFVTKLAPKKYAAQLMGVWFFFVSAGNFLAGSLGVLYSKLSHVVFFSVFFATSLLAAFFLMTLLKPIKRMMGGVL